MRNVSIEERATKLAHYIINSKDTVRGAASKFGISKSTVHKDLSERLLKINPILAKEVRKVLDKNKAEEFFDKYCNFSYNGETRIGSNKLELDEENLTLTSTMLE